MSNLTQFLPNVQKFTPVQQGGGVGQLDNKLYVGWGNDWKLHCQVDSTDFGTVWPISVAGNAATAGTANSANSAGYATSAGTANSATYATSAGTANSATSANTANSATYATSASTANSAGYATSAGTANSANTAVSAATPPQFDSTTSIATTKFLQSNGLRFGEGITSVTANRILSVNDIGRTCWFAGNYTVTMPTPASLGIPVGATVTFYNTGSISCVQAGAGASFDSITSPVLLQYGEFVTFVATTATQWAQFGNANLGKTGSFASCMGTNGYQKVCGMILQWGQLTTTSAHTLNFNINFNAAFPTACAQIVATPAYTVNTGYGVVYYHLMNKTSSNAVFQYGSYDGLTHQHTCQWIAIGY